MPAPPPGAGDRRPGRRRACASAGTRGETCCGRRPAPASPPVLRFVSHRAPLSRRCRRPRLRSETNPCPPRRSRRAPPAAHPREGPARLPPGDGPPSAPRRGVRGPGEPPRRAWPRPSGGAQLPRPVRRRSAPPGPGTRGGGCAVRDPCASRGSPPPAAAAGKRGGEEGGQGQAPALEPPRV